MWGYLFGGNPATKKEAPKRAIIELRTHLDTLGKKEKHLETLISEQEGIARKNVNTNKLVAKNALKKKKVYENDLVRLQAQIASLEQQSTAIESANLNFETMKVMQRGAKAMKQIHGGLDIDKVDSTMDEIREQVALSEEVSEAISRPLGQEVDEDELDDELEDLQQQVLDERMVSAGPAPVSKLPQAPTTEPPTIQQPIAQDEDDEEEEELRKLQTEMAL